MARVYDELRPDGGARVLVDRLWPRGLHRDDPRVGRWCKQVAPSTTATKHLEQSHLGVFNAVLEER